MKGIALAILISVGALAQVPYQRAHGAQEPRRIQRSRPANHLKKVKPKTKVAGPKMGQRGAGVPHRVKKARMNRAKK